MSRQQSAWSPRTRGLSLAAILCSALAVGMTIGLSIPLVSLFMERLGYTSTLIGMNAATMALAVVLAGPFVPRIAARLGTVPTLLLGNAVSAAGLALFPLYSAALALFVLRGVIGFGAALNWIVTETWINILPSERWRGRVVALYAILFGAGLALGPVILAVVGTTGQVPFAVCAALLLASGLPAALVYRQAPTIGANHQRMRIAAALRLAPVGILAALMSGIAEESLLALLPLWGLGVGLDTTDAVYLTTLFAAGGVLLMLPVGWLSDRLDRFGLLLGITVLGALCTLALPALSERPALLSATVLALGGATASLYVIGLTLIGELSVTRDVDLLSLNAVFVMAYTTGMVIGPITAGAGMELQPPHGLMAVLGLLFVLFIPVAWRLRRRRALPCA